VELFDLSLWAVPMGIALAVVALVWWRWVLPLFGAVVGVPIGGVVGRYAWEWFADRPPWLDFGSEFEGLDWVIGFASVGGLVGALTGLGVSVWRRSRVHP
jgi:hypothetical protein